MRSGSTRPGRVARTADINDRALVSSSPAGWVAAAASETMGILSLARDRPDLRARLGRAVAGRRHDGTPVTLEDVGVAGAMAALLRDALEPNLLQTGEGGPALVHGTSWAHLALGSCSVVAELGTAGLVDAVVVESGYGADLGAEKYFDIKCRAGGIIPAAAVLVATVRGQRIHGVENLSKQIGNVLLFGIPVVVAVNPFPGDAASDLDTVVRGALAAGAQAAVVCDHHVRVARVLSDWPRQPGRRRRAEATRSARSTRTIFPWSRRSRRSRAASTELPASTSPRGLAPVGQTRGPRVRLAAHLHGEDAVLAEPRPGPCRAAVGIPPAGPRRSPRRRRRIRHRRRRRRGLHAWPPGAAGGETIDIDPAGNIAGLA